MTRLFLQGVLAVAIIAAGLVVGEHLRAAREQLTAGQAAAGPRASATAVIPPTAPPTPIATMRSLPVPVPLPTPSPAARTVVPTPFTTPFAGAKTLLSGTVTKGGAPVRGAQVMVYPSDASNHGPTPVPPASGMAVTDALGTYQVQLPPGTYRVGAFRDYNNPVRDFGDGFTWVTWYGDAYVIGLGKDVVVSANPVLADIAILPSVKIAGRVIGRDGVGVPGAQLALWRYVAGIQFPFGGGTTDAGGRFSLSHVAMSVTLAIQTNGKTGGAGTTVDLDLRGDRTDLIVTVDRGNIVTGTLRDSAGKPLADTNFGVTPTDTQFMCGWCNGRSEASGRFTISLPSTTVRFRNWPMNASDPDLLSAEYVISSDMTLDPVLQKR